MFDTMKMQCINKTLNKTYDNIKFIKNGMFYNKDVENTNSNTGFGIYSLFKNTANTVDLNLIKL